MATTDAGPVTVEYRCDDGTPFPVTFRDAEDAARTWRLEQEHVIGPRTPLAAGLAALGGDGGARAYVECGLPNPSWWAKGPDAKGFSYFAELGPSAEELSEIMDGCGRLVETHGSALGIWRERNLPAVREVCDWLQRSPDASSAELADRHDHAFHHTMISAMVAGNDSRLVAECLEGVVEDPALTAHELAQGHDNETVAAAQALWPIARATRGDARLRAALGSGEPAAAMAALRTAEEHGDFFRAVDEFLSVYGWRAELWSIDHPTWREQGPGFWAVVRQLAGDGAIPPEEVRRRAEARREALVAELAARLPEEGRARFERRVGRLATYVPVREDRALWQLVISGSLRHAVLSRGRQLAATGVLDDAADVLLLVPSELDDPATIDRAALAARRDEHRGWARRRPPVVIGGADAATLGASAGATVIGVGASRGRVRARARIVLDLADSGRLQPGEVLVCPTTAPPWTPLFAVAGAVVTDAGGLGSHAAIAAREYGLPCVVGATDATVRIPDGADVVVDGTTGTVALA